MPPSSLARTVTGLDVSSSAVRAVQVAAGPRGPRVLRAGAEPLPPGAVEAGQVRDADEVTRSIKRLWHTHRFGPRVRLGVGSGSVLARQVELDWMPPADLRKAMRYLVADLLPVPVDDANIDHVLLEEFESPATVGGAATRQVRILLVATARDGVDALTRCVQAAGLRPVTADLAPLALLRAAARASTRAQGAPGATEAVVEVGSDTLLLAVHTQGTPHFIRIIPGAGTGRNLQLDDGTAARVAAEIGDTLRFYRDQGHGNPVVRRLVLTGSGATVPGFAERCAHLTGLPCEPLDVVPAAASRRHAVPTTDLAVAFGLCLGSAA